MAAMASRVGGPTTRGVQCLSDETFFLSLSFYRFRAATDVSLTTKYLHLQC